MAYNIITHFRITLHICTISRGEVQFALHCMALNQVVDNSNRVPLIQLNFYTKSCYYNNRLSRPDSTRGNFKDHHHQQDGHTISASAHQQLIILLYYYASIKIESTVGVLAIVTNLKHQTRMAVIDNQYWEMSCTTLSLILNCRC